jgi:hypothetical protein
MSNLTLMELTNMAAENDTPSVLKLWKGIGGQEPEIVEMIARVADCLETMKERQRTEAIIYMLEIGAQIGYFGALRDCDKVVGGGGEPC